MEDLKWWVCHDLTSWNDYNCGLDHGIPYMNFIYAAIAFCMVSYFFYRRVQRWIKQGKPSGEGGYNGHITSVVRCEGRIKYIEYLAWLNIWCMGAFFVGGPVILGIIFFGTLITVFNYVGKGLKHLVETAVKGRKA